MQEISHPRQDYPVIGSAAPDAIRLGRFYDMGAKAITGRIGYGGERHALVFGPNGSGKGMRIAAVNLLQTADRSMLVFDPKGELAAITASYRRTLGDVYVVNPFGIHTDRPGYEDLESVGYNPLAKLDPRSPSFNRAAAQLAEALIAVNDKDPHWDTSARSLVAAIIMYVVMEARNMLSPEIKALVGLDPPSLFPEKGIPTMARVRELLCLASERASAANDFRGMGIPALALAMMKTSIAGLRNKASQFASWTDEIQSIASAARRQTESFDDDEIAIDLAKDGFRMSALKKRPTTVYLILPPDLLERHAKWLRLVLTAAMQAVMRPREFGEPKVLFLLDEFASLGRVELIETVWAQVRGYGIQLMPIFQDLKQLQDIYPGRWQSFMAQAGVVNFFTPGDDLTAEYISKRTGDTTAVIESLNFSDSDATSTGTGGSGPTNSVSNTSSISSSRQPTKVPLIQAHSLYGMREGATISFMAGVSNVIPGYAPPYWDIHQCVGRARENPYYSARNSNPYRLS